MNPIDIYNKYKLEIASIPQNEYYITNLYSKFENFKNDYICSMIASNIDTQVDLVDNQYCNKKDETKHITENISSNVLKYYKYLLSYEPRFLATMDNCKYQNFVKTVDDKLEEILIYECKSYDFESFGYYLLNSCVPIAIKIIVCYNQSIFQNRSDIHLNTPRYNIDRVVNELNSKYKLDINLTTSSKDSDKIDASLFNPNKFKNNENNYENCYIEYYKNYLKLNDATDNSKSMINASKLDLVIFDDDEIIIDRKHVKNVLQKNECIIIDIDLKRYNIMKYSESIEKSDSKFVIKFDDL